MAHPPVRARRLHPAWVVLVASFAVLLVGSGVRATPTVMIEPLGDEFGWGVDQISLAVGINLVMFGAMAPFSAALMDRFGVRRVAVVALAAMAAGAAATIAMTSLWQLDLLWGVLIGAATGCLSTPLAAIVATRWFVVRRGLATGLLSAAYASGQLIFLPTLAFTTREAGWQWAVALVALAAAVCIPVTLLLIRDHPADHGVPPFGGARVEPPPVALGNPFGRTILAFREAAVTRIFWLLAATFFICGATTVGIIGTHLIPAAHDHGIGEVQAAGLLALIGVFDLIGVTTSGWLTDRWDPARLLFCFYALRGLSLFFLPLVLGRTALGTAAFVVVFGLDWVATVPPTVAITVSAFGRERAGVIFGWIFAAHQLGAASAAWAGGLIRASADTYVPAFLGTGLMGVAAAAMTLGMGASRRGPRIAVPAATTSVT